MFQKQIFLTSSRFGALQNFFRSCIFFIGSTTIRKKYDKNSIDLAYFAATSFLHFNGICQ